MCGIFAYVGTKANAAQIVLKGLKSLEYRGYDSWGVAVVPIAQFQSKAGRPMAKKLNVKKETGKIGGANVNDLPSGMLAIGHTRWATHGNVTKTNAHPLTDCSQTIGLVHNGIIENYDQLKTNLILKKHRFVSQTDTETAVHLIEENLKKMDFVQAVKNAFNQLSGYNAIIVTDSGQKRIIAVKNGSPLIIGVSKTENYIASDAAALLLFTEKICFLEDDQMAVINCHKVTLLDLKTDKNIPLVTQKSGWIPEQTQKGRFKYFMLKEIYEQPQIITRIATTVIDEDIISMIKQKTPEKTYLLGCGTAAHACMVGSYLFSKVAKKHINWVLASEFGFQLNFLNPDNLVIALSQSGETMDIIDSVKKAKDKGATIMALVNNFGSTLYRLAHKKLLLRAGPEISVASTKVFIAKIAYLILLAYAYKNALPTGKKLLLSSVKSAQKVLNPKHIKKIAALADKYKNKQHLYVIGRGLSYPLSLEAALKIKEISYIHAEGMAAGELKHGTLALIEKDTPCIVFLPNDESYGSNLAAAMEVKARGGRIVGISYTHHEIFDDYLNVDDCQEATIIPNVVTSQLFAYFLAIKKGLDPDKPRNLAKSVTVR